MFIKEIELFKGMSQDVMSEIAGSAIEESCSAGQVLFEQGDPAEHFYVLEEGNVRLEVGQQSHINHILNNTGEAFGWSSLVDRDVYTASAKCLADSKLIKIKKQKLERIFAKDTASGFTFYKRLAGIIGQRLINAYNAVSAPIREEVPASEE